MLRAVRNQMKEATGDLFELAKGKVIVITTNGFVKNDGCAVMGRGCALQAARKWPELPKALGRELKQHGNKVFNFKVDGYKSLVTFPVKHKWFEEASLDLIRISALRLSNKADNWKWKEVFVPKPGCGNGGLDWEDVKPVLEEFLDDRFTIVDFVKQLNMGQNTDTK